eukprot:1200839-Rhodomonas_salina.1
MPSTGADCGAATHESGMQYAMGRVCGSEIGYGGASVRCVAQHEATHLRHRTLWAWGVGGG